VIISSHISSLCPLFLQLLSLGLLLLQLLDLGLLFLQLLIIARLKNSLSIFLFDLYLLLAFPNSLEVAILMKFLNHMILLLTCSVLGVCWVCLVLLYFLALHSSAKITSVRFLQNT
jgi:hypothetical protein